MTNGDKLIMGGKVLEFSADKYYNAGREEGRKEGRNEGRNEGRICMLWELVNRHLLSLKDAADSIHMSVEEFTKQASAFSV